MRCFFLSWVQLRWVVTSCHRLASAFRAPLEVEIPGICLEEITLA